MDLKCTLSSVNISHNLMLKDSISLKHSGLDSTEVFILCVVSIVSCILVIIMVIIYVKSNRKKQLNAIQSSEKSDEKFEDKAPKERLNSLDRIDKTKISYDLSNTGIIDRKDKSPISNVDEKVIINNDFLAYEEKNKVNEQNHIVFESNFRHNINALEIEKENDLHYLYMHYKDVGPTPDSNQAGEEAKNERNMEIYHINASKSNISKEIYHFANQQRIDYNERDPQSGNFNINDRIIDPDFELSEYIKGESAKSNDEPNEDIDQNNSPNKLEKNKENILADYYEIRIIDKDFMHNHKEKAEKLNQEPKDEKRIEKKASRGNIGQHINYMNEVRKKIPPNS